MQIEATRSTQQNQHHLSQQLEAYRRGCCALSLRDQDDKLATPIPISSVSTPRCLLDAPCRSQSHKSSRKILTMHAQPSSCICYLGFATTSMTESPRKNIFAISLSLLTPRAFFFPFPPPPLRSVHISVTPSSTMFMWRSKALTRASSLRLLRRLMRTGEEVDTAVERRERGPLCRAALGSAMAEVAGSLEAETAEVAECGG